MPKKTRITAATTPATRAIIDSSSVPALLDFASIGSILPQAQGGPGGSQDVVRPGDEQHPSKLASEITRPRHRVLKIPDRLDLNLHPPGDPSQLIRRKRPPTGL